MPGKIFKADLSTEYFFDEGCYIAELINNPADPDVSIARARVETGKTTQWHALKNTTERYLITAGHGLVEIEGLEPTAVEPGDAVLIPPGSAQRIRCTSDKDLVFYAICSPRFKRDCYQALE